MASTIAFIPSGEDSFLVDPMMHSGGGEPDRMAAAGQAGGFAARVHRGALTRIIINNETTDTVTA